MEATDNPTKRLNLCIGKQILHMRNASGKSQKEITASAGLSGSMLNKYETGENLPSLTSLFLLSDIFKIPIDQFLLDYHPDFIIYTIDSYLARIDQQKSRSVLNELRDLIDGE